MTRFPLYFALVRITLIWAKFYFRGLADVGHPETLGKQTPACMRTAGQLAGRLQVNKASEKRALLGLTHRVEVDGRRNVLGKQYGGSSHGAKRSSSRGGRVCRGNSSRRRGRSSDTRGAGTGKESGPAST